MAENNMNFMNYLYTPVGMPVSSLKRKWELSSVVKPAAENSINYAIKNEMSGLAVNLEKGISTNPIKMAETLAADIAQLPIKEQEKLFGNLKIMLGAKPFIKAMENIQTKIAQVKGIERPSLDFSIKRLCLMAKENGLNLSLLIKK